MFQITNLLEKIKIRTFLSLVLFFLISIFNLKLSFNTSSAEAYVCNGFLNSDTTVIEDLSEIVNSNYIPPGTWAADYALMAFHGVLITQDDPKLHNMGLLVDGGGLCGPTCITNIVASKDFYTSHGRSTYWAKHADTLLKSLLDSYQRTALRLEDHSGQNPLLGTFIKFFTGEFNPEALSLGVYVKNISPLSLNQMQSVLHIENGLLQSVVQFINPSSPFYGNRHAIVIIGLNTDKRELILSDPNDASVLIRALYTIDENQAIEFNLEDELYENNLNDSRVRLEEVFSFTIQSL